MKKLSLLLFVAVCSCFVLSRDSNLQAALLYDNGPFINGLGTHPDGSDENYPHTGMTSRGFNADDGSGFKIADDFTVADSLWEIDSFIFHAYQGGAISSPAIDQVVLRIWDGNPSDAGSAVVWGDSTTNRFASAFLLNVYVVLTMGAADDTRRLQEITASTPALTLAAGEYWAEWSFGGDGAYTGPWQPVIRIAGQTITGNALQLIGSWSPIIDSALATAQGVPFSINGDACIDNDGDGYGTGGACEGADCNDADAAIHAAVTYYRDADNDGYGNEDNGSDFCLLTPPLGYAESAPGFDVDDDDAFYSDTLPACTVRVIPGLLGLLIGEREQTRSLFVIRQRGTNFGDNPVVKWESDAIRVVSSQIVFKRFMFMRVTFNGEPLEWKEYRVLIGDCEGSIKWAR